MPLGELWWMSLLRTVTGWCTSYLREGPPGVSAALSVHTELPAGGSIKALIPPPQTSVWLREAQGSAQSDKTLIRERLGHHMPRHAEHTRHSPARTQNSVSMENTAKRTPRSKQATPQSRSFSTRLLEEDPTKSIQPRRCVKIA